MSIRNSYNFLEISPFVTTSGVVGAGRILGLAAEGYQLLINLLPDDNEHAVPGERALVESQGVAYAYVPVDFMRPTLADYQQFCEIMDANTERKTHIHCAANWRVSAFYGLYAEQRGLWTQASTDALIAGLWEPQQFPPWMALMAAIRRPRSAPEITNPG